MLGIVTGTVTRSKPTDWGYMFTVSERVVKKDGGSFDKFVSCSGKEPVMEGEVVTVQGIVECKPNESKPQYPYTNLIFCTIVARHEPPSREPREYAPSEETFAEEIPFAFLPYDSLDITRCGHMRR